MDPSELKKVLQENRDKITKLKVGVETLTVQADGPLQAIGEHALKLMELSNYYSTVFLITYKALKEQSLMNINITELLMNLPTVTEQLMALTGTLTSLKEEYPKMVMQSLNGSLSGAIQSFNTELVSATQINVASYKEQVSNITINKEKIMESLSEVINSSLKDLSANISEYVKKNINNAKESIAPEINTYIREKMKLMYGKIQENIQKSLSDIFQESEKPVIKKNIEIQKEITKKSEAQVTIKPENVLEYVKAQDGSLPYGVIVRHFYAVYTKDENVKKQIDDAVNTLVSNGSLIQDGRSLKIKNYVKPSASINIDPKEVIALVEENSGEVASSALARQFYKKYPKTPELISWLDETIDTLVKNKSLIKSDRFVYTPKAYEGKISEQPK